MKYVIAFILGAVCGIAAFIFLCCVAVGKMAEEEDQRLREMKGTVIPHDCQLYRIYRQNLLWQGPPADAGCNQVQGVASG